MKNKLILVSVALFLCSCADWQVRHTQQDYVCRNDGGVSSYAGGILSKVHCKTGKHVKYSGVVVPSEFALKSKHFAVKE